MINVRSYIRHGRVSPYNAIQLSSMCLGHCSDTSHGVYSRVVFITLVVVYPEAIIRGWLLTGKIQCTGYVIKYVCR